MWACVVVIESIGGRRITLLKKKIHVIQGRYIGSGVNFQGGKIYLFLLNVSKHIAEEKINSNNLPIINQ